MQPLKYLLNWLLDNANPDHSLFTAGDLRCLFPDLADGAFNTLLSRAVDAKVLVKVCKKIFNYRFATFGHSIIISFSDRAK